MDPYRQFNLSNQRPSMPPGQRPRGRTAQRQNMQAAQRPNMQTGQRPNMQTAQRPIMQTAQRPNMQTGQRPNMQTAQRPNMHTGQRPNIQTITMTNMHTPQGPNMQRPNMHTAPMPNMQTGPRPAPRPSNNNMQAAPPPNFQGVRGGGEQDWGGRVLGQVSMVRPSAATTVMQTATTSAGMFNHYQVHRPSPAGQAPPQPRPPPPTADVKPMVVPRSTKKTKPSDPINLCTPSPSPSPPSTTAAGDAPPQQQQQPPVSASGKQLPWWDSFLDGRPNQGPAIQTATHPMGVQAVAGMLRTDVPQFVQTKPALMPSLNLSQQQHHQQQQQDLAPQPSNSQARGDFGQAQGDFAMFASGTSRLPVLSDKGYIEIGPTGPGFNPDFQEQGSIAATCENSVSTAMPTTACNVPSGDFSQDLNESRGTGVYIDVAVDYNHPPLQEAATTDHSTLEQTDASEQMNSVTESVSDPVGTLAGNSTRANSAKDSSEIEHEESSSSNKSKKKIPATKKTVSKKGKATGKQGKGKGAGNKGTSEKNTKDTQKSDQEETGSSQRSTPKPRGRPPSRKKARRSSSADSRTASEAGSISPLPGWTDSQDSWDSESAQSVKRQYNKRKVDNSPSKKRVTRSQQRKGGSTASASKSPPKSPLRLPQGSKAAKARQISNTLQKKKKGAISNLHKDHGQQDTASSEALTPPRSLRSRDPPVLTLEIPDSPASSTPVLEQADRGSTSTPTPPNLGVERPPSHCDSPKSVRSQDSGVRSVDRPSTPEQEKLEKIKLIKEEIEKCKEMLQAEVAELEKGRSTNIDIPALQESPAVSSVAQATETRDGSPTPPCVPFKREPVFLDLDQDKPLPDVAATDVPCPPENTADEDSKMHDLGFEVFTNVHAEESQVVESDLLDLIPDSPQSNCVTVSDETPTLDVECDDVAEDWLSNFSNVRTVAVQTDECLKLASFERLRQHLEQQKSGPAPLKAFIPMQAPIGGNVAVPLTQTPHFVNLLRPPRPASNNMPHAMMPGAMMGTGMAPQPPNPQSFLPHGANKRPAPVFTDISSPAKRFRKNQAIASGRVRGIGKASSSTEVINLSDSDEGDDPARSASPQAASDTLIQKAVSGKTKDAKTKMGISIQAIHLIKLRHNVNRSCNPEPRTFYMGFVEGQHKWLTVLAKIMNGLVKYQCALCPRDFPQPMNVHEHMRLEHCNYLYLINGKGKAKQMLRFLYCRHCNFVTCDKPAIWFHFVLFHSVAVMAENINVTPDAASYTLMTTNGDLRRASQAFMCLDCKGVELNRTRMCSHVLRQHSSSHAIGGGFVKMKEIDLTKVTIKGQPAQKSVGDDTLMHRSISQDCYVCVECSMVHHNEQHQLSHLMDMHSDKTLLYLCVKCEMRFDFPFDIASHIRNTHKESQKQHCSVTLVEYNADTDEYNECDPSPKPAAAAAASLAPQKSKGTSPAKGSSVVDPSEVVELDDSDDDDLEVVSYKPGNKAGAKGKSLRAQRTPSKNQSSAARNAAIGLTITPRKSTMCFNTNFSDQVHRVSNQVQSPAAAAGVGALQQNAPPPQQPTTTASTTSNTVLVGDGASSQPPAQTVQQPTSTLMVTDPPPAPPQTMLVVNQPQLVPIIPGPVTQPQAILFAQPPTSLVTQVTQPLPLVVAQPQLQPLPVDTQTQPVLTQPPAQQLPTVTDNQNSPATPTVAQSPVSAADPAENTNCQVDGPANVVYMTSADPGRTRHDSGSSLENERTRTAVSDPPASQTTPKSLSLDSQDGGDPLIHRDAPESASGLDPEAQPPQDQSEADELPDLCSYRHRGSLAESEVGVDAIDSSGGVSNVVQGAGHKDKLYQGVTMPNLPTETNSSYVGAFESFLQTSDNKDTETAKSPTEQSQSSAQ